MELSDYGIKEVTAPAEKTSGSNPPEMTNELAQAIVAEFVDIEAANGYVAIGQKHGATTAQVAELHTAYLAALPVVEDTES